MATIQSTKRRTIAKRLCSSLLIAVVCAASSLLARVPAIAATGTWSGTAGATWNTSTTNWLNLSGTPWDLTNGGTNTAVFNSAAATPTVSGTVWVNAITFANTATISGGVINLAGTAPTITTTANGTISSLLAGSSGLTKAGASTLTLTGSNSYTGATTVSAGVLALSSAGNLASTGTVAITASGATFDISGADAGRTIGMLTGTAGSTVTLGANSLTVGNATTGTFAGSIGGSGGLTKQGAGTLALSGSNTYTGLTTISAGTLALSGGDNRLPTTGTVNFSANSRLDLGSTNQTLANITVLNANSATGTIAGGGSLTVNGTAADFAIGAATGIGSTSTLDMSGLSNFTYDSPTKNFTVGGQRSGGYASYGVIYLAGGSNSIRAAQVKLTGVAPSNQSSGGSLYLGGTNTIQTDYLGLADNGKFFSVLQFQSGLSGSPTLALRGLNGGRLATMNVFNESFGGLGGPFYATFDVSAGTLDASVGTLTIGSMSGGTGLSGTATFTMGSGTLDATSILLGQVLTGSTGATATFTVSGGTVKAGTFTIGDQAASTTGTVSSTVNLNGGATLAGGTITAGANTATRTFNWNDGTISNYDANTNLTVRSGLTLTLAATGNHSFDIGSGRTGSVDAVISGSGNLSKLGAGVLTFTGSNSYTGVTTISAGTLALSSAGNLASTGTVAIIASGATFDISGASAGRTIGMLTGTAGSRVTLGANSLTVGDTTTGTFAGGIGGSGGLTKQGAGTLVLSGSNSFSGGLTLTGGQVQIANANALGTGTFTTNVNADTTIPFNLPTSGTIANNITINTPGTTRYYYFQQNQSNNLTLAGNITVASGNGNQFTLNGVSTGTVTLTGSNRFGSDVYTSAGMTFRIGGTNAAGSTVWRPDGTTNFVLLDGASFRTTIGNVIASYGMETSGAASVTGDVNSSASGTTAINTPAGAQLTFSGVFRGGGTYNKTGAGTWVVTNQYTDANTTMNILGGTLQVPVFSALGGTTTGASYLVLNGGTLQYTGAGESTAKQFTLGTNGGGLDASGSGTVSFTSTSPVSFTGSGNRTLTLTGTNTGNNTLAMALNNNGADVVSLTKTGAGTWVLSGSNSYSGATTISSGVISFGNKNAFSATSGISIAGGAGLTYTGTADTLSTGITVTSGTGTVTNSGGQTLTLGGTLSKNGTVLRLTGGAFNVTGLITGTTAGASDLVVDAAAVTLSNTNTYNGPTYVYNSGTLSLGIDNAIPNTSAVYLGNNTTRGTLVLGSYTDSISQLLFSGSGGTVSLSGDKTASAQLATNGSLALGSNANLVLTSAGTSAGLYRLISFTSSSGSFASITGTSAAYQVITTSSSIDYQQRAVLGAVGVTNPAVSIITGGSAAFTYTVANSALSGGASLGFTSSSLSANLAGTSSGTAAAGGSSGAISGLVFTGTTVGSGQTGTFTVSAPTAYGATTATGTVSVNVLDHSNAAFSLAGGNNQTIITGGSLGSVTFNLTNAGTGRSALDVSTLSNLSGTTGSAVVASNGSATYTASGFNTTAVGQNKTLTVSLSAGDQQTLSGASAMASYSGTATYTVLDHSNAALALASGGGQTIITGGSFASVGFNLTNAGSNRSAVQVNSLTNLVGGTGSSVVPSGGTGSYTSSILDTTTIGTGTLSVGMLAGDQQSLSGASALQSLTSSATYTVLDHALPGFQASGITNAYAQDVLNINFGSVDESAGQQSFTYSLLNLASQTYGAGLTAGLDFTGVTADGGGFASGLSTFNNLVGGGTSSLFTFTFNPTGQGTFSKTFTLSFYDNRNLSGAASRRDLTISANVIVVPEPGTLALAGLGIGVAAWALRRRK